MTLPLHMKRHYLPLSLMEDILKGVGAYRVSETAKHELRAALESRTEQIAKNAAMYAAHAKRRTIKAEDIRLSVQQASYP